MLGLQVYTSRGCCTEDVQLRDGFESNKFVQLECLAFFDLDL